MSDDNQKDAPVILSAGSLHHTDIPEHIDLDEIRRTAKNMDEATVPLTPELSQFLDRWRMARMNNKRVVGPANRLAQSFGLDHRNPPGSTKK
jgi:hypothetical protein